MPRLFHQTLTQSRGGAADAQALRLKDRQLSYRQLIAQSRQMAHQLLALGLNSEQRVAVYLPKQFETVISFYAISMAGGIFVPINPLLKAPQVAYIGQDCGVSVLITSLSRYQQIKNSLDSVESLELIILTDCSPEQTSADCYCWDQLASPLTENRQAKDNHSSDKMYSEDSQHPYTISSDIAAILYTSGSTGNPKGVVLSHNNLVAGAKSVAEYLANSSDDKLLAVLPFSFDYGLSQLTTAFLSGASVVLIEYLFPRDVIKAVEKYQITGLAAVPPLWIQLAELDWPIGAQASLRYWTNSGGAMPQSTLKLLTQKLPDVSPFLMYGLTEAFRSTYLAPDEIANRPTSIGKAIPDAEILVINAQGQLCQPGEPGELVHRGPHVALGYWNAPQKTAARFKPLPRTITEGLTTEIAVWSGDTVVMDQQGFLFFVGRNDDMIKSSGYRISPSEIEDCVLHHASVSEVVVIGVPHKALGQAIVLVVKPTNKSTFDQQALLKYCQKQLPNFMQPKAIKIKQVLARNPNGKIDRKQLLDQYQQLFA